MKIYFRRHIGHGQSWPVVFQISLQKIFVLKRYFLPTSWCLCSPINHSKTSKSLHMSTQQQYTLVSKKRCTHLFAAVLHALHETVPSVLTVLKLTVDGLGRLLIRSNVLQQLRPEIIQLIKVLYHHVHVSLDRLHSMRQLHSCSMSFTKPPSVSSK